MIRKLTSMLAALVVAIATLAPAAADARDRRGHGYYDRGYNGGYYDHRRRWRDRDDDGDAVAAGVVGLVLGLAIGSMASQSSRYDDGCYDRCARPPPRRCYDPCRRGGYYDEGYYDRRYDDRRYSDRRYDDRRYSDRRYDDGYDPYYERSRCTNRERQWDRYARRYVWVDVPC